MLFSDSVIFSFHNEYEPEKRERISKYIWNASSAADIEPYLLLGLFALESGFDSSVISPKGAKGVAQFMPGTWKWISEEIGMTYDIVSYDGAIYASAYYLKRLIMESEGDIEKALIAYGGYKTKNERALKYVETVMCFTEHGRDYTR
jgi:soluble lytic murein transglycosylase-like protein